MYASNMWKRCGAPLILASWCLTSCQTTPQKAAAPPPESQQVIGESLKQHYMAASAAPPQSKEQQTIIRKMADRASNGKELLLVMRAAVGVFPAGSAGEIELHSTVAAKMMQTATLDQMMDYATQYPVKPETARPFIERMFQLGNESSDPRVWSRIRLAAFHLKVSDLEQQAQAKVNQLAGR